MIPTTIREAVFTLHAQNRSIRDISRALNISRNTVRRLLRKKPVADESPSLPIPLSQLKSAFERAQSNVSRMSELINEESKINVPYSTLTRWVREAGLRAPPVRAGFYVFGPGDEMQHDTSPHRLTLGNVAITAHCAGLVLAYSRRLYIQYYPRFGRFEARQFLLEAARFMDGACRRCVIDNSSVILAGGAGADAIIAPEMVAFGQTLGYSFIAHRVGDPDRKGRIERNFAFVEKNFLPGRHFSDFPDLNQQARQWCEQVANARTKRALGMSPDAAYVMEKTALVALPMVLPPVYDTLERVVDLNGYVSLDTNRYSVPENWVGEAVTVYKYPDRVEIHHRRSGVATHAREIRRRDVRITDPTHHPTPIRASRLPSLEAQLSPDTPELEAYARALKQRGQGRGLRLLQRLIDLQRIYPAEAFRAAIRQAAHYGLYDLGRLEKLILQNVAGNFFAIKGDEDA